MDEGHVVLCNLSGETRVDERDADLLGRLLTRSLFFHAKRRRAPERPFIFYIDECHRFLSGAHVAFINVLLAFFSGSASTSLSQRAMPACFSGM